MKPKKKIVKPKPVKKNEKSKKENKPVRRKDKTVKQKPERSKANRSKQSNKNVGKNKRLSKPTKKLKAKIVLKVRKVSTKGKGKKKGTKNILYFENEKGKQVTRKEVKKKYGLIKEDFKFLQGQASKGAGNREFKSLFDDLKKHRNYDVLIDYDHIINSFPGKYFFYNDQPQTKTYIQNELLKYSRRVTRQIAFYSFKIFCSIIGKQVTINLSEEIIEWAKEQRENKKEDAPIEYSFTDTDGNFILLSS